MTDDTARLAELVEQAVSRASMEINKKLDQIHVLVNSNLLAANRSELAALESSVRLAKEIIGLKRAASVEPSREIFDEIDKTQRKIDLLADTVRERSKQT